MNYKAIAIVLGLVGWGLAGMLALRSAPEPVVQTVEKIVHVDREVIKDRVVTKTVSKPDGTKIVTETSTQTVTKERVDEQTKIRQVPNDVSAQARYSLGLGIRLDPFDPLKRDYTLELGKRLWKTPLWGKVAIGTDKTISLGLSIEF